MNQIEHRKNTSNQEMIRRDHAGIAIIGTLLAGVTFGIAMEKFSPFPMSLSQLKENISNK